MKENKVYSFTDKEISVISLPHGIYLIDDKIVENNENYRNVKCKVKDYKNVRKIERTRIIINYINDKENKISVESYIDEVNRLKAKGNCDYEGIVFENLDDEYKYKKYLKLWTPIYKTIEKISEPLSISLIETKIDTGNKYISSEYANGGDLKDCNIFIYHRPSALKNIVSKTFDELNMKFEKGVSYGATNNKYIWGNSEHSCIQYVVAFGTYIFSKRYERVSANRGTLDNMINSYENDKKNIEKIMKDTYIIHFNEKNINVEKFIKKLDDIKSNINKISPRVKDRDIYYNVKSKINTLIEDIISEAKK